MGRVAGIGGWVVQVFAWATIFFIVAVLSVAVFIPRIAGATPYTVLTGSMRPHYPPGALVVVRPTPEPNISVGDVVTYQLESGKPTVVTHRVVQKSMNLKGQTLFATQGDANNSVDAAPVKPVQIKGKLWYTVPYLGYVNKLITPQSRHVATVVMVSLLLCYSAYMFTSAVGKKLRKRIETKSELLS